MRPASCGKGNSADKIAGAIGAPSFSIVAVGWLAGAIGSHDKVEGHVCNRLCATSGSGALHHFGTPALVGVHAYSEVLSPALLAQLFRPLLLQSYCGTRLDVDGHITAIVALRSLVSASQLWSTAPLWHARSVAHVLVIQEAVTCCDECNPRVWSGCVVLASVSVYVLFCFCLSVLVRNNAIMLGSHSEDTKSLYDDSQVDAQWISAVLFWSTTPIRLARADSGGLCSTPKGFVEAGALLQCLIWMKNAFVLVQYAVMASPLMSLQQPVKCCAFMPFFVEPRVLRSQLLCILCSVVLRWCAVILLPSCVYCVTASLRRRLRSKFRRLFRSTTPLWHARLVSEPRVAFAPCGDFCLGSWSCEASALVHYASMACPGGG